MQGLLLRSLDIGLSFIGIVLSLPLMVAIYLISLLTPGGSPLFFQQRVGKHRKLFTLVKFRTMTVDTDSVGTHLVDSNSITPLGRILRRTKLDELPQLFNVILGQMSLVGPRPCLPNQIDLIDERDKRRVFEVRPGVTGLAQIKEVDMSTPRKLARYDKIMAESMCVNIYVKLLIATALGQGRGDRVKNLDT